MSCFFRTAMSQENRYEQTMMHYLSEIDSSFSGPDKMVVLANKFERVGKAEKDKWLPYYYAAFMQVMAAFTENEPTKMDMYADRAEELISVADSIQADNSEISCVRSLIASCRLVADPMNRYMVYGPLSESYLKEAIAQDTTNPRPYMLRGQGIMHTPPQFGGGCDPAKPMLNLALAKFAEFQPASPLHPRWGEEQVTRMLQECKK